MQLTRHIRPFWGNSAFYRVALLVMIPVALQQLTTAVFNFADSIMLAKVGEWAMSAVAVANKPGLIYNGLFFGFTGAASLLISQYHGAGKLHVCQRLFSLELVLALAFSGLFVALLLCFPEALMRAFVTDPQTIAAGVSFLRIMVWSYVPASFSLVCLFSLRAMGINMLPMVVSMISIAANLFFEWALIFGRLGMPALGVRGPAMGTLLARLLEMGIYVAVLLSRKTPFTLSIAPAKQLGRPLLRDYLHKFVPLTINELVWCGGQLVYFWAYTRIDEKALPAVNVSDQVITIAMVLFQGITSAVAVLVGRHLGANRFGEAKANAKRLYGLTAIVGLLCMLLSLALAQTIGLIFPDLSAEQIALTKRLTHILTCFIPLNVVYLLSFNLLRAGGDTKHAVLLDSFYLWMLPVPIAFLMGLLLPGKLPILPVLLTVQILACLKTFWALRIVRRGTWLNNLTREEA